MYIANHTKSPFCVQSSFLLHHIQNLVQLIDGYLRGSEVFLVAGHDAVGIDSLGRTILESILKIGETGSEGTLYH